ncbi:metallophosphoesterase [Pseudoclavibacter sp. CFCC 11306]|uniref:metallophosphoesterase n=1 Tax=Pseudoclavibacter sp. CFCC 11306 TaxID=1564493 RepID=UPI001301137F|nr:metallophosphoesterase [Pseudoclavibacter sp. CFCC 11306]KAB1657726.1 metallophosphoesterase [Pseudoclavibacter sp. CFCC 11306]
MGSAAPGSSEPSAENDARLSGLRTFASSLGIAALAGIGALAYGSLIERNSFALRQFTVPVLPEGSQPLRMLHVADLHLAPWQRARVAWTRDLASLKPDLVINTGDNYGHAEALPAILDALEPLLDVPGAFVYGSNDYFTPIPKNPLSYLLHSSRVGRETPDIDTAALTHRLVEAGWRNLNNQTAQLTVNGSRIGLVGTGDAHLGNDDPEGLRRRIAGMSADVDLTLGVTHAPYQRVLDGFTSMGAELMLAGHTHGGQVCVPFFGALTTNCDLPRPFVKGLHEWTTGDRSSWLHVSAGLGTSIYAPVRFNCRPEATLLTLVARDEDAPATV